MHLYNADASRLHETESSGKTQCNRREDMIKKQKSDYIYYNVGHL